MNIFKKILFAGIALPLATINVVAQNKGTVKEKTFSPVIRTDKQNEFDPHYYMGVGIGEIRLKTRSNKERFESLSYTLKAGYNFYKFLGAEVRYTRDIGSVEYSFEKISKGSLETYGVFLKPYYSAKNFNIYGLLGYGGVERKWLPVEDYGNAFYSEDDIQYGIGVAFGLSDKI